MAYLTKAIFKSDWIDKTSSETEADDIIDRLIPMVEAEIKSICNQPVEAETVTSYFGMTNAQARLLPYTVPVTYTSLSYRDEPDDAWTAISSGVAVFEQNGLQWLWNRDTFAQPMYKLVLSVGYATASVPKDIVVCGYEMLKELVYETPAAPQGDRFGVSAITEGQGGVTFSKAIQAMRPRVEQRLTPYRWIAL